MCGSTLLCYYSLYVEMALSPSETSMNAAFLVYILWPRVTLAKNPVILCAFEVKVSDK